MLLCVQRNNKRRLDYLQFLITYKYFESKRSIFLNISTYSCNIFHVRTAVIAIVDITPNVSVVRDGQIKAARNIIANIVVVIHIKGNLVLTLLFCLSYVGEFMSSMSK